MSAEVTRRQLEVLRFIGEFVREHHYPPSFREISEHFGWRSAAMASSSHIQALQRKGLLAQDSFSSRAIRVTKAGWAALGVTGCPFCGVGMEARAHG